MNAFSAGGQKSKNPLFLEHNLIDVSSEHSFELKQTIWNKYKKKRFGVPFICIEIYTTQLNKK